MFEEKMMCFFEYVEQNLTENINFEKFEKDFLISIEDIKTIFPLLFNITLSQYIRNRRLSEAGKDFLLTNQRVIDVAFKYCYSSSTSFARSFARYHGILPSKVSSEGIQLKYFPKLSFSFSEKKYATKYEIIERQTIKIVGVFGTIQKEQVTKQIATLKKHLFEKLKKTIEPADLANYKFYQCCENFAKDSFDLYIGIEADTISTFSDLTNLLSSYTIRKGRYFKFSYLISDISVIPNIWESLLKEKLQISGTEYETIQRQTDDSTEKFIYKLYIPIDRGGNIDAD